MSADQPPPPPASPPPSGTPPPHNPYERPGGSPPSRYAWWLVLVGVVLGFVAWVVMSTVLVLATGFGEPVASGQGVVLALLGVVLVLAVAAIVWPRTRRLGQGIILGLAIGLVVAGGICIPLLVGA